MNEKKYAYANTLIETALEILEEIHEEEKEYLVFPNSGNLLIKGYGTSVVVGNQDVDYPYNVEKDHFLENVINGYAIFEKDVKKEIALVNLNASTFDWEKIDPRQFEELCRDVLSSFKTISNCIRTGASGDEGRDIKADENIKTITGNEKRKWCVQCKHYPNHPVKRQDIEDLSTLQTRFGFDVFCLMTSGSFSPNSIRLLEEYEKKGIIIKYMDKQFLENRLMQVPSLMIKYQALL